ncbi:hypothetical protein CH75_06585 [Dyella jiangningensis]|nr:hypothetical protein CH75_06585 [Dyella jiangningensis]
MQYAYFDGYSGLVLQWLDTEAFSYPELPDASFLLEVTPEQVEAGKDGVWFVVNGQLERE